MALWLLFKNCPYFLEIDTEMSTDEIIYLRIALNNPSGENLNGV